MNTIADSLNMPDWAGLYEHAYRTSGFYRNALDALFTTRKRSFSRAVDVIREELSELGGLLRAEEIYFLGRDAGGFQLFTASSFAGEIQVPIERAEALFGHSSVVDLTSEDLFQSGLAVLGDGPYRVARAKLGHRTAGCLIVPVDRKWKDFEDFLFRNAARLVCLAYAFISEESKSKHTLRS